MRQVFSRKAATRRSRSALSMVLILTAAAVHAQTADVLNPGTVSATRTETPVS